MEQISAVVSLFEKYGIFQVLLAGAFIFLLRFTPAVLDTYFLKRFKSIYAVYGVDGNHDVRLYSIFRTEKESEEYINSIRPLLSKKSVVISSEWKFGKKVPGLEAYNPYREEYFDSISPGLSKRVVTRKQTKEPEEYSEQYCMKYESTPRFCFSPKQKSFDGPLEFGYDDAEIEGDPDEEGYKEFEDFKELEDFKRFALAHGKEESIKAGVSDYEIATSWIEKK